MIGAFLDNGHITHLLIIDYKLLVTISSRFSSNSEAKASELLENHEEMFPRYYIFNCTTVSRVVKRLFTESQESI